MHIGCDPGSDSTNNLRSGKSIPSVLYVTRSELRGLTVIEHALESEQAELYKELAGAF